MRDHEYTRTVSAVALGIVLQYTPEEMRDLIIFMCDLTIKEPIKRVVIHGKLVAEWNDEKECWEKVNENGSTESDK